MSELNFGIRAGVQGTTPGTLRSALAGFTRFAQSLPRPITIPPRIGRRSLDLTRDVNLGLAPLVRGIDNIKRTRRGVGSRSQGLREPHGDRRPAGGRDGPQACGGG